MGPAFWWPGFSEKIVAGESLINNLFLRACCLGMHICIPNIISIGRGVPLPAANGSGGGGNKPYWIQLVRIDAWRLVDF